MPGTLDWKGSRRKLLGAAATTGAGLAGLALAGCGDDDDDDDNDGGTPATGTTPGTQPSGGLKIDGDLEIGFISSFTGPLAPVYAPFVNGAKLAVNEINEKGGIGGAKMKIFEADDQGNPAQVPAAALGLIDKKINYCLGPIGSNAISASPALNQGKIVQFGYSDNPELANTSRFPFTFRYVWSPEQSSKLIVDYYRKQGWEKIAILAENTVFGQTDAPTTEKYLKDKGLKPTVFEYFQPGTADFVPLLRKVQDAGTQAIVWWTQGGPEATSVIKNMDSIKLNLPIGGIGFFGGSLVGNVAPEILNRIYGVNWKRATYTDSEKVHPKIQELRDKLDKANQLGGVAGTGVSPFYDMVYHIKAAIEGAKSAESSAVVKWMEKNTYDGVMANYSGVTDKDHTVSKEDQITLTLIGSFDPKVSPFYKRAPGV